MQNLITSRVEVCHISLKDLVASYNYGWGWGRNCIETTQLSSDLNKLYDVNFLKGLYSSICLTDKSVNKNTICTKCGHRASEYLTDAYLFTDVKNREVFCYAHIDDKERMMLHATITPICSRCVNNSEDKSKFSFLLDAGEELIRKRTQTLIFEHKYKMTHNEYVANATIWS